MIEKVKDISNTVYQIIRMWSNTFKPSPLLRFNSTKFCNVDTKPLNDMYYKKGANVTLGEKYKACRLTNGVRVYMIDKSE